MTIEAEDVTAGLLVIGDEILSGRTKDRNIGTLAEHLTRIGIRLAEVRIVGDRRSEIVDAVNAMRGKFTYVFTTGGIGPTHDDITADSIANAFDVTIDVDPRARQLLETYYAGKGQSVSDARLRMARIPAGACLIENAVSGAPGFMIGNVIVMAGVPAIMLGMLESVTPGLRTGVPIKSETVRVLKAESEIAEQFAALQAEYSDVAMGSYPCLVDGHPAADLVLRCRDAERLGEAVANLRKRIESMA